MATFGRSVPVDIVHAPGTPEEKRWSTLMGGDLATKALFHPPDRVKTGDEIHGNVFDEPRIISSVNPVTALDGSVTYWEARMLPLSQWKRENSHLPPRKPSQVLIFISHSSEDREVGKRLTDLLRSALRLPASSIRCTSIEGHRLRGGADTDQQLKREIREAPTFIGVVSPRSVKSMYVLFELGARWGIEKHLVPLLAPGAGADQLVGPLAGINALRADSRADLHQLLGELASELGVTLEPAQAYERQLEDVTLTTVPPTPNANATAGPTSPVDLIKGLSEPAAELLSHAAVDPHGGALVLEMQQGLIVQAGGKQFVQQGNPRSGAQWRAVLDELRGRGFLYEDGSLWLVTEDGFKAADLLAKG
jgi:hypothetical protein